jgi:hypothetical protein
MTILEPAAKVEGNEAAVLKAAVTWLGQQVQSPTDH